MISDITQNEFLVRYYKWSLADAVRESEQGLPLLRTIKDYGALGKLEYLEQQTEVDRRQLLVAAVKNTNRTALELVKESPSVKEKELFTNYSDNIMSFVGKYLDQHYRELAARDPTQKKANKSRLAKLVKRALEPVCGRIVQRDSSRLWTHMTTHGHWEIYTEIDMGGNFDLSYTHSIDLGTTSILKNVISFNRWLGLGETQWTMLKESDEPTAVESITTLCSHFMRAVPELLAGLPNG